MAFGLRQLRRDASCGPAAALLTYLKNVARALRAALADAGTVARTRVGTHVSPLPPTLAQAQALFVIAREYGFRSWPVLKRHVQRRTRTVFADTAGTGAALATSRELFGVLARSDLYWALGHEGANAGSALVGMFAEACQAKVLLAGQGLRRQDVIRHLAHGIPKVLPTRAGAAGVLAADLEAVLHAAYTRAQAARYEAFGVDHLLLGVAALLTADQVGSEANVKRLPGELGAFVATTPRGTGDPTPTRALSRVMQQAVARARRRGDGPVDVDSLLRAVATETKTVAADVVRRYGLA